MQTPVLFLVFNRPDVTKQVFETIRRARPPRLYVAADGARTNRLAEVELCRQVRELATDVDWHCELKTLFRTDNLGCKRAVSTAIDWFFEQEKEGIILEDDCVPNVSFYRFCEQMLESYRNDESIFHIGGSNFQIEKKRKQETQSSYYFSRYNHVWGWATWRRAWQYYDVGMAAWPQMKTDQKFVKVFKKKKEYEYWCEQFEGVYNGRVDTWDYQWSFTCWSNKKLSIIPNRNLISNIGFRADATHTKEDSAYSEMKVEELQFPLTHPEIISVNEVADTYTWKNMFERKLTDKLRSKLQILRNYLFH